MRRDGRWPWKRKGIKRACYHSYKYGNMLYKYFQISCRNKFCLALPCVTSNNLSIEILFCGKLFNAQHCISLLSQRQSSRDAH
jgi:hypothetical protein